jgi:serine protease inhibitor
MIKVDEKGTTAAAVTVIAAAGAGMPLPTEPFEMVCDKPFMFVLESYGQALFTGVVNNPAGQP